MKKIISYSLWGSNPKYTYGALENARTAKDFYPGWECWFYCAIDVPYEVIYELEELENTKVFTTKEPGNWKFTTKRFTAISEPDVERVLIRDCDNRFSEREVQAVNEWIDSGNILHVMKDHPWHGGFPILAGQWGLSNGFEYDMKELLSEYKNTEQYHYDQIFLANYVWEKYKNSCTIHDEIFNNFAFPSERKDLHFIGEPYNENNQPCDPKHRKILMEFLKK